MNGYIKPPIGVAPHWFVYHKRMTELSSAVSRYLEHIGQHHSTVKPGDYYKLIASWCDEIKALALLEADKEATDEAID